MHLFFILPSTGFLGWQLRAMNSTLFIIGVIGNIISVLVFVSPINTLLWLYYGLTKPDGLLIATVNGFGAVMETIYIALFLIYAVDNAKRVKTAKLVAVLDIGFFGVVFAATTFAIGGLDMKIMVIGLICACLSVFMYGSPLTAVRTVIASRSVEYMPFFLSFFLFLNGGVWATYAILDKDVFLGVPNGIGCFLGGIQLVIYAIYRISKVGFQSHDSDEAAYDASASLLSSEAGRHGQNDVSARV
ncbi:unnamed protein product [Triticum turgidum subsp. durum]|uniref:Bidirectional sugar transporter SWEET n=1 Tax=Triticum turgidum subsp. durum TaxID=4567 RepID=A0A9R0WZ54_TRITD|nr:unnamed protein product [Triticum turgidum subsp. durum]